MDNLENKNLQTFENTNNNNENLDENRKDITPPPTKRALKVAYSNSSKTDPQGSYTGIPENEDEEPVQDVDDL